MRLSSRAWFLAFLALVVAVAAPTWAEDSLKVSYQGRLTDDAGNPLDTTVNMAFALYNATSAPLWNETQEAVETMDGLFNVVLGSKIPIAESIFSEPELYLGITVGSDPEISPRTELTHVPFAAAANRVEGDVETGEGYMHLKNIDGDSIFTFNTHVSGGSLELTTPIFGGKGRLPLLELNGSSTSGTLTLFRPDVTWLGDPAVKLSASMTEGSRLDIFQPDKSPTGGVVQLGATPTAGGFLSIHAAEPLLAEKVRLGGSPMDTGFVRLFGGDHGSEYKLVELTSHSDLGGRINMYSAASLDEGIVFSLNSNPTGGFSMRMFQPQPEPPGKTAIEMSVSTAKGSGSGMMSLYDKDSARTMLSAGLVQLSHPNNTDLPGAWLSTDSSQSQFNMRGVQPPMGGEPGVISMVARSDSAKVGIGTNTPSEALHVVGNILATGTVTAMTSTKYKSNISDINNALDRITRLHGVTFNWNREDYAEMKFPTKRQVGFLAEEVNDIVPEVVLEDKDGPLAVDYGRLTAVLVEAVKELKAENEELRQRIELLELR